jgi:hypothetical protein
MSAHPAFPSPPSLMCGPCPVIFLPVPTAAAAVSRARTPHPDAASAPVMAGAPTPHHSPPPPQSIPFRNGRLHSIGAHHRRHPFPSDARPPRSPSDPIKGQGARLSSLHSSPPPFPCSPSPSVLRTRVPTTAALTTITWPPHCLSSSDPRTTEFPMSHCPSPAPWMEPLDTGAAGGQAPTSSVPPSMAGPPWTEVGRGPLPRGPSPRLFPRKNNSWKFHFPALCT